MRPTAEPHHSMNHLHSCFGLDYGKLYPINPSVSSLRGAPGSFMTRGCWVLGAPRDHQDDQLPMKPNDTDGLFP